VFAIGSQLLDPKEVSKAEARNKGVQKKKKREKKPHME
jgi:hypothetical protein